MSTEGNAPAAPAADAPVIDQNAAPVPELKQDDLSPRFAALSRRENEIRLREKQIADKEKRTKQLEEEYTAKSKRFTKEELRKNPTSILEESGMSFEELIQAHLDRADGKPLEPDVKEEIKALKEQIALDKKEREDRAAKESEALATKQISDYKVGMTEYLKSDLDSFELINAYEAFEDVYSVIEEYFELHGEMPDPQDAKNSIKKAAEVVENHIFELVSKGRNAKKFIPKSEEPFVDPLLNPQTPATPAIPTTPPTLNNRQAVATSAAPRQLVSDEESKRRAARLLKFD